MGNIWDVLTWFFYISPTFIVQLAILEAMFAHHLDRKPWFWARLGAGVLICVGTLWLAAYTVNMSWLVNAVTYLLLFFLTVVVMQVCFEERFATVLFCGIAAYAAQNLVYRIDSLMELYGVVWRLSNYMSYQAAYLVVFWGTFIVVSTVVYFVFVRRMIRRDMARLHSVKVYVLSITTLAITVFLCTWTNMFFWESLALTTIIYLFSCLSCVFVLCLQSGMLQTEGLKQDLEVVKQLWEQDRKQYEISRENIDIINIKCHDLRFRLQALYTTDGPATREELEEIEQAITIYDSCVSTGCEPLDTILTEKSLFCNKNGIKFTCMVDGSKLSFIAPADIYSLFGNIISNAVEAVRQVEDREYRIITFAVKQVGDMLLVTEENYYTGLLSLDGGLPVTSKEDKLNHGYGMKSIQMLVKKYGGDMDVDVKDNIFTLKLLFPHGA